MKKFILAIFLAMFSIGAFASSPVTTTGANPLTTTKTVTNEEQITKSENQLNQYFLGRYTYISACGEVWDISYTDDAPGFLLDYAESLADGACVTGETWFIIYYYQY